MVMPVAACHGEVAASLIGLKLHRGTLGWFAISVKGSTHLIRPRPSSTARIVSTLYNTKPASYLTNYLDLESS